MSLARNQNAEILSWDVRPRSFSNPNPDIHNRETRGSDLPIAHDQLTGDCVHAFRRRRLVAAFGTRRQFVIWEGRTKC